MGLQCGAHLGLQCGARLGFQCGAHSRFQCGAKNEARKKRRRMCLWSARPDKKGRRQINVYGLLMSDLPRIGNGKGTFHKVVGFRANHCRRKVKPIIYPPPLVATALASPSIAATGSDNRGYRVDNPYITQGVVLT